LEIVMKLFHVILVSLTTAIVAAGTPGCAADAADPSGVTSATTEGLATAAARWEKLGETRVDGLVDHDVVTVAQDDSRYSAIQIRVEDSSLVMLQIKVVFGNGETFEPNVRLVFDANTQSRVIDLPGNTRFIRRIEFHYANLPGGGDAHVSVLGMNASPPSAWRELGERRVNGSFDRDTILVGGEEGSFSAIQVRVKDSSLVMEDIRVTFGDGEVFEPHVRLVFDANTRSRVIDLPGTERFIKHVDFAYSNIPGGGDATVQLWATH
jgi:hypothetical protein